MVLEKKPAPGTKRSCTGLIGAECLRLFPPGSIQTLAQYNSATFLSPSGRLLRVDKPRPQAYMVDRRIFDGQLAAAAQGSGATYSFDTLVENIETTPGKVRITAATGGRQNVVEARAVVVASGSGTRLPEMLGLRPMRAFATGCQTEVACSVPGLEVYLGRETAPGFFGWLVPFAPGRARLGLMVRGNNGGRLLTNLWQKLNLSGKVTSPVSEVHYGVVPLRPLARTYAARGLVLGDAAGQVKPTTGGGIYYGLLCAALAAESVHEAIVKEDFSAARMSVYEERWRRHLLGELRVGYLARKVFERLTDKQMERIFDAVLSRGIHRELLESGDFSFDWHGRLILRLLKYQVLDAPLGVLGRFLASRQMREPEAVPVALGRPGPHIP